MNRLALITPQTEPLVQPSALSAGQRTTINPAVVYVESLGSKVSKAGMISSLNSAARTISPELEGDSLAWRKVAWQGINAPLIRAIMAKLKGAPATRNKALAALKGVARACWEMNLLSGDDYEKVRGIKQDAGSREVSGRYLPNDEIGQLLRTCARDASPAGVRDAALFTIAAAAGLRRAELASIKVEAVQEIALNEMLGVKLIGKRNKERTVYLVGSAERAFRDWLAVRGRASGPVFCAIRKGGTILPEKEVTPIALDLTLRKRAAQAGLSNMSFHDFRRTNASNLLDHGADISTVAKLLGHSNVQTTARYDRRGERAKMKASELVTVPYFKPTFCNSIKGVP